MKKYHYLVVGLILFIGVFFPVLIQKGGILIYYGDSYEQMLSFYLGAWEKVHSSGFSFWNWSNLYGASAVADIYYYLLSPFFLMSLLFPRNSLPQVFSILTIIKLFLVYLFGYYWLKNLFKNDALSIFGAIFLAMNGWVWFVYEYNLFFDGYVFYFLVLWCFELLLKKQKSISFVLSVSALCITNYYCAYMFMPFLFIYICIRCYQSKQQKAWLRSIARYLGLIFTAVSISAVVLFPCADMILQTPRLAQNELGALLFTNFKRMFRFLSSVLIMPVYRMEPNLLIHSSIPFSSFGWSSGASLFVSFSTPLLLCGIPFFKNRLRRGQFLIAYGIAFLFLSIPLFYLLFQGTFETRWFYMISILNVLAMLASIQEILEGNFGVKKIAFSAGITSLGIVAVFAVSLFFHYSLFDNYRLIVLILLMGIGFMLFYAVALMKKNIAALIFLAVAELIVTSNLRFSLDRSMTMSDFLYETDVKEELSDHVNQLSSSFYRVYYSDVMKLRENYPIVNNLKGGSGYSSLYNFAQEEFLERFKLNWKVSQAPDRYLTNNLLSFRYWITNDYEEFQPYGYKYIDYFQEYLIFENSYFMELGFMQKNTLSEGAFGQLSSLKQDRLLPYYVIIPDSKNNHYVFQDSLQKIGTDIQTGYFEYEGSNSEQGTNVIVENLGMPNVKIRFMLAGNEVAFHEFSRYIYVSFFLPSYIEYDKIIIEVADTYSIEGAFSVYLEQDFTAYQQQMEHLKQTEFTNVIVDKDKIDADIIVNESGMAVTAIPYDKGWSVYVDGIKVPIVKVNFGFVGFNLNEGKHHVTFSYFPPYLGLGLFVSGISLTGYLSYYFWIELQRK